MPQTSLAEYVQALDKAGLLTRIKEEKRVDELPALMEANPDGLASPDLNAAAKSMHLI